MTTDQLTYERRGEMEGTDAVQSLTVAFTPCPEPRPFLRLVSRANTPVKGGRP